ncbi:hypothetical protein FHX77_000318 [Bifidobacterium commune]|uniref:hypothetical protein n=1 Tax=Bifidobacterium commune TaxID=1505727 RepID=UPI000B847C72|nr:hypothetical protein [Bifidobacterium commune]MBB2954938.1 hypothetical protein [Bifidobacterium commune]
MGRLAWSHASSVQTICPDGKKAQAGAEANVKNLKTIKISRKVPTQRSNRVSQEHLRTIEVVDWLIAHPSERAQIEAVNDAFQASAEKAIAGLTEKQKIRFADHFWCDFFASLVQLIDKGQLTINKVQQAVAEGVSNALITMVFDSIEKSRASSYGNKPGTINKNRNKTTRKVADRQSGLTAAVLKVVVKDVLISVFKAYSKSLTSNLAIYKKHFQILAILLCPNPQAHKLVWDTCLAPLLAESIANSLVQNLKSKNIRIPTVDVWDKQPVSAKAILEYVL